MEERPVRERARGHVAEPVVERRKPPSDPGHHRHLLGRVAGHELGVLVIGWLPAELGVEHADVVGEEPVHGGLLGRVVRRVEGLLRLKNAAVALIEDPEQLGVDVRQLLTRIGPRGVHRRRYAVRHDRPVPSVLGPLRDRVAEVLADHPLERLHLTRLVQPTKQVVERAVLEHDHDHMVQSVGSIGARHQ